ncbi:Putative tyrosine-protein phosphatase auxilin [Cricetulus griseus]|uniref:Putative tyrosine-protein phosphatase auxilin n=1 Tax=Cricetulus griseus TaxID=10029 RepID=G3HY56_CRIGR|nr:Putative tyrosine-protein phosphatase auxilin [Cricetulus griseus]
MFIFCNLYSTPGPAVRLLYAKRPGIGLSPSHRRYSNGSAGCGLSDARVLQKVGFLGALV